MSGLQINQEDEYSLDEEMPSVAQPRETGGILKISRSG